MLLLLLVIVSCTKSKRVTCDSISSPKVNGDYWRDGLLQAPDGKLYTWINMTAWVFGEPGINYSVFYGLKNGSYFLAGDIASGNCTVIGPYSDYVVVFPKINGKICNNKSVRVDEDNFVWVTELGHCTVNNPIEQPTKPIENKTQESNQPIIIPPPQKPSCSDSDGGLNYYVKGNVTGTQSDGSPNDMIYEDKCALGHSGNPDADKDPNALLEAYCFKGIFGYGYDYYSCPNGCKDGACIDNSNVS